MDYSYKGLEPIDNEEQGYASMADDANVEELTETIEDLSEDNERSDDITDIAGMFTDNNSDSNNFTPFTSKAEALVYMMINSPRPLGENNLKFILFMMKQTGCVSTSLDKLKKLQLPGLNLYNNYNDSNHNVLVFITNWSSLIW